MANINSGLSNERLVLSVQNSDKLIQVDADGNIRLPGERPNNDDYALNVTTANNIYLTQTSFNQHLTASNPHNLDKKDVGLNNVDNTSDTNKPISIATQAALDLKSNEGHSHTYITTTVGTDNISRRVYFANTSASNSAAALVYDDDFKYNPATDTLTVPNINGLVSKATADSDGNAINSTYLKKSGGTITGDVSISGNLNVSGTTTTINSTNLEISDKLLELAKGNNVALTSPAGIYVSKYDGQNTGALIFDNTGTAYVGDCILNSNNEIDINNSDLQPLATRSNSTDLTDGQVMVWDANNSKLIGSDDFIKKNLGRGITFDESGRLILSIDSSNGSLYFNGSNPGHPLSVTQATKLAVDNRYYYGCIGTSGYDYAIKQALTDNDNAPHSGEFDATWTEDDKTKARDLLNAEVAITTSTTTPSTLMNNTRYDLTATARTSITLIPSSDYETGDVLFRTGSSILLNSSNIKFKGRDCFKDGTFDIQPNTNYYINFMNYGNLIVGFVATI